MLFSMNYSIFPTKGKATRHSKSLLLEREMISIMKTWGNKPTEDNAWHLMVTDTAVGVKLNFLFAQLTVLGRGSGRETSEEIFLPAEGDDLFGTEALRGIRCSCCSHKVSLLPAK